MGKNKTNGNGSLKDSLVICRASGVEVRGTLIKLTRFAVVFEIDGPYNILRLSEVLEDFRIIFHEHTIYSGRATVYNLMSIGQPVICAANLNENSWTGIEFNLAAECKGELQEKFSEFFHEWQQVYGVLPEYKLVIADIQMFLTDLRLWFEQYELRLPEVPANDREKVERELINGVEQPIVRTLNDLFEKFELVARKVPEDRQSVHSLYAKRQLHPLLMCSPFMHRIFQKPLGYAGDYEMVRMILRDPHEGNSLFARMLNRWFLSQIPAEAHRQRVRLLTQRLVEEGLRVKRQKRRLRVFNLGCGPAQEVVDFIRQYDLSDGADFTLLDFNEETLKYAESAVSEAIGHHHRATSIEMKKKSVLQMSKTPERVTKDKYDLVYCAGLFDYLQDSVSKQLMNTMYGMVEPGGLLIATNVEIGNPIQKIMDLIFEWRLIYRTHRELAEFAPDGTDADNYKISAETTACNIFIEVRKPPAY
jgi:extracellular factor (EF) 3-hydroxypalmitic acid methyl ester biosynthesis protein